MHQPPPAEQSTFESRAQYNLQATADDDDEEEHYELEKVPPSIPKRPNYRPKPLRWPFIVCIIAILTVLMALVVYAYETMPNSDSTATIVARHIVLPREQSSSAGQQAPTAELLLSSTAEPSPSHSQVNAISSGSTSLPLLSSERSDKPSSNVIGGSDASTQSTTTASESEIMRQMEGTSASVSTVSGASGAVVFSTDLADQLKVPAARTTTLSTTSGLGGPGASSLTTTQTTTRVVTSAVVVTPGTIIEVTTEFPEQTPGGDDTPSTGFYTSTGVTVMPTTVATIATSTGPAVVYVSVGTTEITIVSTVSTRTTFEVATTPTGTMPMSFTVITTIGGSVSTIVSTPVPTTLVTSISGKLSTITSTPRPTTRLSTIMASTVTFTSVSRPTMTGSADTIITKVERVGFTSSDYFVGKFLPVILAVTITIPLRIIDLNAKLYQPFFAMAQEGGALGKNSLTLQFDGWKGFLTPFEVLMQGHPVPFITTLMLWSSALLVPLATEAIGMKLHGTCKITAIEGCGIQLGVSTLSARALVAMIAFIIVLLLVLLYLLRSWDTGLHANPWSIAGISSLARNASIRSHINDFKASEKAMAEKRYMLGYFENGQGRHEYGIIYSDDSSQNLQAVVSGALPADDEMDGTNQRYVAKQSRKPVPFIALTYWWRLGFIFFLASLFILVLYYHVTLRVQTSFKQATDSQSWGVRFFLSALGVIIVFCWESIFVSIAIISPYYHMDRQSQHPESSILLTRPTNSFYGVYAAILEGNVVLMLAAFMAILAEFLPILLTNVPYNLTQTLATHNICAVTSISILALMLVTLVASLFTKWPDMPVDPRSIAGAMYYINESRMLEDFEGLSKLNSEDREKKVKELGRRYFYGAISGKDGRRMAVDSIESVEDTAYTGGHWFLPQIEPNREEDCHEDHEDEHSYEHGLENHEANHEIRHGQAQRSNYMEVGLV
ncbi:hypothetical protein LZ31DRAFT_609791 [Colletotrichum somersetense]|nr:hypothetical protein LZ31DRAFT_609791 [Colletotrichum somersetense]